MPASNPAFGLPQNMPDQSESVQPGGQVRVGSSGNASDTSDHTLVQPSQAIPQTVPNKADNDPAHPLQDPQVAADKFGQTGALGAGAANVAAALTTNAEHEAATSRQGEMTQNIQHPYAYQNTHQPQPDAGLSNGEEEGFKRRVYREIPTRLPLHPNTRYCERCEIVKPYRAHHCRHCGTCVLGMDHHCPWIGQCCGARNHIYFVAFCFWSCVGRAFVALLAQMSLR